MLTKLRPLLLALLITSCAGARPELPALSRPDVLPVEVQGGAIRGKNVDNVVKNHLNAWEYIHKLEALNGKTKGKRSK